MIAAPVAGLIQLLLSIPDDRFADELVRLVVECEFVAPDDSLSARWRVP